MADPTPKQPKQLKYDHPGRLVAFLVPVDGLEQRFCREHLDEDLNKLETIPQVRTELRLGRLPSSAVVYVAHRVQVREKDEGSGFWQNVNKLHVGGPIELSKYSLSGIDPDDLGGVNISALVDAIQGVCKSERNGIVFTARLSAEKDPVQKTVKLFNA